MSNNVHNLFTYVALVVVAISSLWTMGCASEQVVWRKYPSMTIAELSLPEKATLRINKSYQRMHGEDVVTTPKTKKSNRVIKLPKFLCEEMKDCLKMFYDIKPGDRIFQSLSKHVLSTEMERGCKAAGVKVIRIHDLRHSHVSFLINKGFTALEIGNRVGHETERITYRYAHLFPTKQDEMADFLDNERFSNDTEKEA